MNKVETIYALPKAKQRAVGYARVSTLDEQQDSSFKTQINELEASIKENPNLTYIGIFKDKKSGAYTKGRTDFNLMIELATAGEIDIIYTKSITRFARNLTDTIKYINELKQLNIEVFFQKEDISSLDPKMEFVLNVLAIHAEEELKNISENTKWSIKRKIHARGNFTNKLYGYIIHNNKWTINESEATIVRMIFDMYLSNLTYSEIIKNLFNLGIKSPNGNKIWHQATIESMLQNEKFAGHMALSKTYTLNGQTIRTRRSNREDYFVYEHHEPIIEPAQFLKASKLRESRACVNKKISLFDQNHTPFYNFVFSSMNKKYLRFVVERPKGKYEIPTLFCYDKQKSNRVMITIKNLFLILNDSLIKLKNSTIGLNSMFLNYIQTELSTNDSILKSQNTDKINSLSSKTLLLKCKAKVPNFVKKVRTFKPLSSIEDFKLMIDKVTIDDSYTCIIKLNILKDLNAELPLLSSIINLKVGSKQKDIKYILMA